MEHLKNFRKAASKAEQERLANALDTTTNYLFSHLGVHRKVSIEQAEVIECETAKIAACNGGSTPIIQRDMLCAVCARCPLACSVRASQDLA